MRVKKTLLVLSITLILLVVFGITSLACTDIVLGKSVTPDGSIVTSHTCDGQYDSRINIISAADHESGTMTPVYKGIIRAYPQFFEKHPYMRGYGKMEKLGEIPEVSHTYKIFSIAYPFANEHQVIIGETTLGNEKECSPNKDEAIMYIEQLEIFGLQRAKTARECIKVMGELAEEYGYADRGDCLTVTDSNEAWVFEIYAVGPLWVKESGKSGAVWCAQRVPDDHITVIPNMSRIKEIDPSDNENFICSDNYMDVAIELGLYDPDSGEPFIWNFAYSNAKNKSRDGNWIRAWRVYSLLAPSGNWKMEHAPFYPFSVKAEKKASFQDVITMFRDVMKGTPYDMTEDPDWYIEAPSGPDRGKWVKSSLASPQVLGYWRSLLDIEYFRPMGRYYCSYFFVSQTRDWLPNEIGGVLWFGLDNPENSPFVPLYVGVEEVPESWKILDRKKFDKNSAWWAFGSVDDQVNHLYGQLKPMLDDVLMPMQQEMYDMQEAIEQTALQLYEKSPELAKKFLTDYTGSQMKKAESTYWDLFERFVFELNNNTTRVIY